MTTDIMDLAALAAQMVAAEKVAQSLPEPASGEELRVYVAEFGPERFRVLWTLSEDVDCESFWIDGGFISSHKTRASADVKAFNVNYRLTQRSGALAQGIEAPLGGETGTGSTVGESPVGNADAPKNNHLPHDRKNSKKGVSRG